MMKLVLETNVTANDVGTDDAGRAKIVQFDGPDDSTLYVRVQSWDETEVHAAIEDMIGKRVRVAVETL